MCPSFSLYRVMTGSPSSLSYWFSFLYPDSTIWPFINEWPVFNRQKSSHHFNSSQNKFCTLLKIMLGNIIVYKDMIYAGTFQLFTKKVNYATSAHWALTNGWWNGHASADVLNLFHWSGAQCHSERTKAQKRKTDYTIYNVDKNVPLQEPPPYHGGGIWIP